MTLNKTLLVIFAPMLLFVVWFIVFSPYYKTKTEICELYSQPEQNQQPIKVNRFYCIQDMSPTALLQQSGKPSPIIRHDDPTLNE